MSMSRQDLRTSGDLVMAPRVPHGLAAAVEGLTREVIRNRPEDIYVFAAQHFEELLKLRDEYGAVTNLPGKSTNNNSALREMNKSLKKRNRVEKNSERGGWSMNETARVLERHRSIFGDKGRKVSTDEVRALGNEKENKSGNREDLDMLVTSTRRRQGSNERFVRRKIVSRDNSLDTREVKVKSDVRNPKIISQIPTLNQAGGLLAKDIKSELRKNRNSSKDRRSVRDRTERKTTERLEIASRHGGATKKTLTRSSRETSLDKLTENDGDKEANNQKQKTEDSATALSRIPRTLSMDRVREFVVKKFRSSESWEELSSTDYVDKVQDVIDDAAPSILRKVNELSTRSAGRSSRGYESVDESTSTSTRSDKSNQTDDVRSRSAMSDSRRSRKSRRTNKSKISGADSLEGIETLVSETEHVKETDAEPKKTKGSATDSEALPSPNLSLPAVRPPSSKNHSRSVSRSDSDNLVLPPISPEAPKSAKQREELVLPSLQISREILRAADDVELILPDPPKDEIFKDSLNVTPEIPASPRPDSLELDEARNIDTVTAPASVKEKLIEIQEAEERLRNVLDSGQTEEVGKGQAELGMKEKLIEIEETEKRIENIVKPEAQVVQEIARDLGMKEKLMEIEESEKRIEKILNPEPQDKKDNKDEKDFGMKEKLIEIQETEKRIEKILNPETKNDENDAGFMKEKLMEIEEAEKRLRNVFNSTSGKEDESNQNLGAINSVPKTPFIPEIPSEYVTSANEEVATPNDAEHLRDHKENQLSPESNNGGDTNEGLKEPKGREVETSVEILPSGISDSLGTSYVLTEGSPYEIPDSVTTVIIPERNVETPSSDIVEIVLEDDLKEGFKKTQEGQISLRNILDNFGEIVDQETPVGPSAVDVDFIRNLKTSNDVIIPKQDLAQIREEEDKEIAETEAVAIALADIAESEEILELQEVKTTGDLESLQAEEELKDPRNTEDNLKKDEDILHLEEVKEALEDRNTETSGSLDPEETRERGGFSDPEDGINRKTINITDSGTTESTDEVKETTISDDGGNTAAESSVTSPSCGEDVEACRNSESSNEVKETTISDEPADGNGKNLLSLAPQCFGSMPHVPELNLDSLQDITVSSFQLSDDQTAEEDSGAEPPQSGNKASHVSQDREPVEEEIIVKEKLAVKEDPCTKINAYVTEPDTDNVAPGSMETDSSESQDTATSEPGQTRIGELEEKSMPESTDACAEIQEVRLSAKQEPNEELIELHEDVTETVSEENSKDVSEKESEEKSEDLREVVHEKKSEEDTSQAFEEVHKETSTNLVEVEENSEVIPGKIVGVKDARQAFEAVHDVTSKDVLKEVTDDKLEMVPKKIVEAGDARRASEELHEETSMDVVEKGTEKKPEVVHETIVLVEGVNEKNAGATPEQVHGEVVVEEVTKKTLVDMPEDVTDKSSEIGLQKVSDEVHEEVSKQETEKVLEEDPEEVLKDATEKELEEKLQLVNTEGPGTEPEKIHEETTEDEIVKLATEEPEEVGENVAGNVLEDNSERLPEAILETVSDGLAGRETRKEPEEIHEAENGANEQKSDEKKHEEKPEGLHVKMVEEVVEEKREEVDKVVSEKLLEDRPKEKPEDILGTISNEVSEVDAEEEPEEAVSKSTISETNADCSKRPTEGIEGETKSKDVELECKNEQESFSASKASVPEVALSRSPEEAVDRSVSVKLDHSVAVLNPPKAEVVTNDLDDYPNSGERLEYHIYVPEVTAVGSQDGNSTTESSTFHSAATKIQAGVRGFLTRRRLQSAQRRSSTLDSVPSIQDSVAADTSYLEPIEEVGLAQAATTIQSNYRGYKARQRLRREDAVQKNTMSVENAFGGNGLQHTGEFHDCLPLPPLQLSDSEKFTKGGGKLADLKSSQENYKEEIIDDKTLDMKNKHNQETNFVVISGNDSALQSQYLNFITSIEEVPDETDHSIIQNGPDTSKIIDPFSTLKSTAGIESLPLDNPSVDSSVSVREPLAVPGTPTGLIIEELSKTEDESLAAVPITDSLDLPGLSLEGAVNDREETCKTEEKEKEASLGTMSFSMNVDDMLGFGAESDPTSKMKPILEVTFTPRDLLKLSNMSTSGDRVESPVTMMQIVPKSVDRSDDDRETEVKSASGSEKPQTLSKIEDEDADKNSMNFPLEKNDPF